MENAQGYSHIHTYTYVCMYEMHKAIHTYIHMYMYVCMNSLVHFPFFIVILHGEWLGLGWIKGEHHIIIISCDHIIA